MISSAVLSPEKFNLQIFECNAEIRVTGASISERLSSLFTVKVDLGSEDIIQPDRVIGKEALFRIRGEIGKRHFHGVIHEFASAGMKGRFHLYEAVLVPYLWTLTQRQTSRIFQNKSVPDIISDVLTNGRIYSDQFEFRLQGEYAPRDYCVQYNETDFAFISRLLEDEGIHYFFEQTGNKDVLVFADSRAGAKPTPRAEVMTLRDSGGMVPTEEGAYEFRFRNNYVPGKYASNDFNDEHPSFPLQIENPAGQSDPAEIYEYPGQYKDVEEGQRLAKIRLEEKKALNAVGTGSSTVPFLTPGHTVRLKGHPIKNFNREYLIVAVSHLGTEPQALEEVQTRPGTYSNTFTVIPVEQPFRPPRLTPKPKIAGTQTAIVMGPEMEEIYTDEQGRVKIKFHWDRTPVRDESVSCWVRVAQLWTGAAWGAMFIPRVGQEVIVSFIDGNPDQPIITGRVYNGANPVPHPLPENKTKSTIMSQSTPACGGGNELSFEDAAGNENLYLHAQKDMTTRTENDEKHWTGHDFISTVEGDRVNVTGRERKDLVLKNKKTYVMGHSTEIVKKSKNINVAGGFVMDVAGSQRTHVGGRLNAVVGQNHTDEVGFDRKMRIGRDLRIGARRRTRFISGDHFEIRVGKSKIILRRDGLVAISGRVIRLDATERITQTGKMIELNP